MKHAGLLALTLTATLAHADDIKWSADQKTAFAAAKSGHKLMMVEIYTGEDPLCKRFDEGSLKDPKVVSLLKNFVAFKTDIGKGEKAMAIKYSAAVLPTILFLQSDGKLVSKLVGYQAGPDFAESIQVALDSFTQFAAVKQKLEKVPKDGEANAKYATFVSAQSDPMSGKTPVGAPYLEKALASSYRGPYIVKALEAVGDGYAGMAGKESKALDCYQKALKFASSPADKSIALIGMMYLQLDSNKAAAKATAQQLIDMKGATPEWVYVAKETIQGLSKA